MDHGEQEPTMDREEETIILRPTFPPSQVIYQRQDSWDVHKPLVPTAEKFTPGQAHTQRTIDKDRNEASVTTGKTDLRGKTMLNYYFHINCNLSLFILSLK